MNLNLKGLLAIAAVLCAANVKAQDYVITTKGDTIHCKVFSTFWSTKYRLNDNDPGKKIDSDEIIEYLDTKNNYLVRAVYPEGKKKREYYYTKLKGAITIYEERIQNGWYTEKIWYFSKGTDTVYKLKFNTLGGKSRDVRKNKLGEMFKDDSEVYEKYLYDNKFTFDQILSLVKQYNKNHPTTI
ncbi:hypothetical protein ACFQZX_01455 [Mucilaginibacter litoreus]|uniref:DUF4468 domain-containing protein n=1 Tax=Mucilaginibacter litoreus TaxID=1048221 RepID=A0ABW3AP61_9SPHI